MKNWNIAPLLLGKGPREKSRFTYLKNPGVKIEIGMIAWLIFNEDERIMIDTGPSDPSITAKFHKPFSQTSEQNLRAQLNRFHLCFDDIQMVINTHLHWDHCYGNSLFKRARFFVQQREMDYARDPLPSQLEMYEAKQEGITPPFEEMEFELIDGDAEIMPGIRVMLTPGHTKGSQTVCISTRGGVYVIPGDNIPLFDNIRVPDQSPFIPSGILTDLEAYFCSLDRIKNINGTILPGHDLEVLKQTLYP